MRLGIVLLTAAAAALLVLAVIILPAGEPGVATSATDTPTRIPTAVIPSEAATVATEPHRAISIIGKIPIIGVRVTCTDGLFSWQVDSVVDASDLSRWPPRDDTGVC